MLDTSFIGLDSTPVFANTSMYALRTENERYNSRFKSTGQGADVGKKNIQSVENLNTIAHIALLSIAIAVVITKQKTAVRSRKRLIRAA